MGKKRAVSVKRLAETLIKYRPNGFASDFDENKRLISEIMDFPSKVIRNKVAGYITRIKRREAFAPARVAHMAATDSSNLRRRRGRFRRRR